MSALSWSFKAIDQTSSPALRMSSAVDKYTTSLTKADKIARSAELSMKSMGSVKTPLALQSTPKQLSGFSRLVQLAGRLGGNEAAGGVLKLGSALTQVDGALGKVGLSLGGVATTAVGGLLGGVAAVVAALTAATVAIGYFGAKAVIAFGQAAISAYSFREKTLVGMEVMLKSGTKASELYARALKFAFQSPLDTETVVSGFQKLLARGFDTSEIERVMRAVSDLNTVMGGTAADANGIMLALGQMKAKPILSMEELNAQLSERGLPVGKVMEQIGKITGQSVTEVDKAIRAGKISSKVGIEAVLNTIEEGFGGASEKAMGLISGLWAQLAGSSVLFWNKAFDMKGGGLNRFAEGVRGAMKSLLGVFFSSDGQLTATGNKTVEMMNRMGGILADLMGNVDTGQLTAAFDKVLIVVEKVLPHIEAFGKGFKEGLISGLGPLLKAFGAITGDKAADAQKVAEAIGMIGKALGFVVGAGVTFTAVFGKALLDIAVNAAVAINWIVELPGRVKGAVVGVYESVAGFVGAMIGAGMNLALGFANGILAGISSVISAAKSLGQAAKNALSSFLQEKSPSRLFWKSGVNAALGVAGGMDAETPTVRESAMSMIAPPQPKQLAASYGAAAAASGGGAGGGRAGMQVRIENVNISGGGSRAEVKRGMLEAWEEIALEMGLQPST